MRAPILVMHDDPDELTAWLAPRTHAALGVQGRPPSDVGDGPEIVDLPVDGPLAALRLVLDGMQRRAARRGAPVVVIRPVDGGPPSIPALVEVVARRLPVAIDLTTTSWVADGSLWWTRSVQTVRLALATHNRTSSRAAAEVVTELRGFASGTPSCRWFADVAAGATSGDPESWSVALAAHFLDEVVAALLGLVGREPGLLSAM